MSVMGLLNAKNLKKAKSLLDDNRDKIGGVVSKATKHVDKATKGKSAGVTAKLNDAAHKYSGTDRATDKPGEQPATTPAEQPAD